MPPAKFGDTEKERLLREIAGGEDGDEEGGAAAACGPAARAAAAAHGSDAEREAWLRAAAARGADFFAALDASQRPTVPFVNRPKPGAAPRALRQKLLNRLAGQHLAVAAAAAGEGDPAAAAARAELRARAFKRAVEQETAAFARAASPAVYANFAARENAAAWLLTERAAEQEAAHRAALAAEAGPAPGAVPALPPPRNRPRQAAVLPLMPPPQLAPAAPAELAEPDALEEDDLDWGAAAPERDAADAAALKRARRAVVAELDRLPAAAQLRLEARVAAAARCAEAAAARGLAGAALARLVADHVEAELWRR